MNNCNWVAWKMNDLFEQFLHLLFLPPTTTISAAHYYLSHTGVSSLLQFNQVDQLLRKLRQIYPEYAHSFYTLLVVGKITHFRPFFLHVQNACSTKSLGGKFTFYLYNHQIHKSDWGYFGFDSWNNALKTDIVNYTHHLQGKEVYWDTKNSFIETGCGYLGCCPQYFLNVRHIPPASNDHYLEIAILIENGGNQPENEIIPKVRILYHDFQNELQRLKDLQAKCATYDEIIPFHHPSKEFLKKRKYHHPVLYQKLAELFQIVNNGATRGTPKIFQKDAYTIEQKTKAQPIIQEIISYCEKKHQEFTDELAKRLQKVSACSFV